MEKNKKIVIIIGVVLLLIVLVLYLANLIFTSPDCGSMSSSQDIVRSEVTKISRSIDDVIDFKDMASTQTIYLEKNLHIGREALPYTLTISDKGGIVITTSNKCGDVQRFGSFGTDLEKVNGSTIICDRSTLQNGAQLEVSKESEYSYDTIQATLTHTMTIDITGCGGEITFEQVSIEN